MAKRWRLEVSSIDPGGPRRTVDVVAPNWMAAIKEGRAALGEVAEIPKGASCQVAPGGRVSVLAPAERRSYQLVPLVGDAATAPAPSPAVQAAAVRPHKTPASLDLVPLRARDTEPTEDSPIYYHERVYAVAPGVPLEQMEKNAREKLEELKKSMAGGPRGQFHNLAVYDHEWKDKPERPALLVLQWKDWRDEVVVSWPLADSAAHGIQVDFDPTADADHDERLSEAFEACEDLFFIGDARAGLEYATHLLDELVPSELVIGALFVRGGKLVVEAAVGSPELLGSTLPLNHGLLAVALTQPEQVSRFDAAHADPNFEPDSDGGSEHRSEGMLYLPLVAEGTIFGLLRATNRDPGPRYGARDVEIAELIRKQTAAFLAARCG
jgi:hypothetical protein